ncbi:MAG: hypothetical protein M1814_005148 [Vezdaea aestivalis]|nr:MAG: hypothetical protein M1814_005148 [Vezdaea aestivalis]
MDAGFVDDGAQFLDSNATRYMNAPNRSLDVYNDLPGTEYNLQETENRAALYLQPATYSTPDLSLPKFPVDNRRRSSNSPLAGYPTSVSQLPKSSYVASPKPRSYSPKLKDLIKREEVLHDDAVQQWQANIGRCGKRESNESDDWVSLEGDSPTLPWAPLRPNLPQRQSSASNTRKVPPPALHLMDQNEERPLSRFSMTSSESDGGTSTVHFQKISFFSRSRSNSQANSHKRKESNVSPTTNVPKRTFPEKRSRLATLAHVNKSKLQKRLLRSPRRFSSIVATILPSDIRSPSGPDTPHPTASPRSPLSDKVAKLTIPFQHSSSQVKQAIIRVGKNVILSAEERRRENLKNSIVVVSKSRQVEPTLGWI